MSEVERRDIAMFFSILSGAVTVILGGIFCRLRSPSAFDMLLGIIITGALSSYLFSHFYAWKDTFASNLLYAIALVTLFYFGILCGKTITQSLHKKTW